MCRLSAFVGAPICAADLVTRPCRSIITQSFDARERLAGDASTPGYLNGDGFGLGWYSTDAADKVPCVYRQARPAWNDPNLASIAAKVFTRVLFAHVRAASPGLDVSEGTCHPFRVGRYLWMHNGGLGSFSALRRRMLTALTGDAFDFAVTHGSSDTALCFAIFLSKIGDPMALSPPEKIRACMDDTIREIETAVHAERDMATSLLNFVVSDGETLIATRYVINLSDPKSPPASLYIATGNTYESDGSALGNYAMTHSDRRPSLAIISSEPLTESRSDWISVPRNFCVVVTKSMHILQFPILAAPGQQPDSSISRVLGSLSAKVPCDMAANASSGSLPAMGGRPQQTSGRALTFQNGSTSSPLPTQTDRTVRWNSTTQVACPVGAAVRATINVPHRPLLCQAILQSFLCTGSADGAIHVWDMDDRCHHATIETSSHAVLTLTAHDGYEILVVGNSASMILVYALSAGNLFKQRLAIDCDGMGDVVALVILDNKLFAGFSDTTVRCVTKDIAGDLQRVESSANSAWNEPESYSENGKLVKLGPESLFPGNSGTSSHSGCVFSIASCHSGSLLCTGGGDGILRIWDVEKEECVQERHDHAGAILALVVYEVPHGTMLFSGSRDQSVKVWVWDGERGFICKRTLRRHRDEIIFLTLADNRLISGSADGVICVWCAETLRFICQYRDTKLKYGAVSAEHNTLFTSLDEGSIQVRDIVSTEKEMKERDARKSPGRPQHGHEMSPSNRSKDGSTTSSTDYHNGVKLTPAAGGINGGATSVDENPQGSPSAIVSEVDDDSDEADFLIPGVTNEVVHAPPILLRDPEGNNGNGSVGLDVSLSDLSLAMKANGNPCAELKSPVLTSKAFERRLMQDVLAKFVSFPTVSNSSQHRDECWQGARYIARFLEEMGASVKYFNCDSADRPGEKDEIPSHLSSRDAKVFASTSKCNPIVQARFASSNSNAKTLTFYGHYDVMPAVDTGKWNSDPWTLTDVDGFLYGRGSTDNKGPIISMVFAVKKLLEESKEGLGVNIMLVLQGEGEVANAGFKEYINSNKHDFESTELILTSNSYWLGDDTPCITYGFRGVIELLVTVEGGSHDLHSGVHGGALFEPTNDLINILGTMVDSTGIVCIPAFYDDVKDLTEEEMERLRSVNFDMGDYQRRTGVHHFTSSDPTDLLMSRWRRPSISITSIETSNLSGFYSVVPRTAQAKVSIRYVPDQDPEKLENAVRAHLSFEIRKRRSPNKLRVDCMNRGDWWLGNPAGTEFQIAANAVRSVWGVEPEYVCEGGSMPLFSFLAKTLDAPLVQVPLGQSSDGAHLPNERIRSLNLFNGKEVLQRIIKEFADSDGVIKPDAA